LSYFDEAYNFLGTNNIILEKCRTEGKNALVHCQLGKSRSATIVIMYLMKHLGMTLREAFKYTKEKRYIVNPNLGFIR
jgi:protein-tyrosine phosphatase